MGIKNWFQLSKDRANIMGTGSKLTGSKIVPSSQISGERPFKYINDPHAAQSTTSDNNLSPLSIQDQWFEEELCFLL